MAKDTYCTDCDVYKKWVESYKIKESDEKTGASKNPFGGYFGIIAAKWLGVLN